MTIDALSNLDPLDRYPVLKAALLKAQGWGESRFERLREALRVLDEATSAGAIRNQIYQDVRGTVSRAVWDAWQAGLDDRHARRPDFDALSEAGQKLLQDTSILGLHDVIAVHKRAHRLQADGDPAILAIQAFTQDLQPLLAIFAALKEKVVKGRAPRAITPPANPNKIEKTCACCMRAIAVLANTGRMAHHGYERPSEGFQTASCPGIRFRPLEISPEGLDAMISWTIGSIGRIEQAIVDFPSVTSMEVPDRRPGVQGTRIPGTSRRLYPMRTLTAADEPDWSAHRTRKLESMRSNLAHETQTLSSLKQVRENWRPELPIDPRLIGWADPQELAPFLAEQSTPSDGAQHGDDNVPTLVPRAIRPRN